MALSSWRQSAIVEWTASCFPAVTASGGWVCIVSKIHKHTESCSIYEGNMKERFRIMVAYWYDNKIMSKSNNIMNWSLLCMHSDEQTDRYIYIYTNVLIIQISTIKFKCLGLWWVLWEISWPPTMPESEEYQLRFCRFSFQFDR